MGERRVVKEPPWVTALLDQRIQALKTGEWKGHGMFNDIAKVVVVPLRDKPEEVDSEEWERTCDNCGTYCPPGPEDSFYSGMIEKLVNDLRLIFFYGMCPECNKEVEDA